MLRSGSGPINSHGLLPQALLAVLAQDGILGGWCADSLTPWDEPDSERRAPRPRWPAKHRPHHPMPQCRNAAMETQ